jgi:probable HAF family extracellular repeat protein
MQSLGAITGDPFEGWAFDISDNGRVVVGFSSTDGVSEAFAWTKRGGRRDLGDIPGGRFYSFAHGVSRNGSVIVGVSEGDDGQTAFVWDRRNGMRAIEDVLRDDFDIDPGVRLHSAWDVSSDGRTIIGTAVNAIGDFQAYVAVLPFVTFEPVESELTFVVPEPSSTLLLAMLAAAGLIGYGWRESVVKCAPQSESPDFRLTPPLE